MIISVLEALNTHHQKFYRQLVDQQSPFSAKVCFSTDAIVHRAFQTLGGGGGWVGI